MEDKKVEKPKTTLSKSKTVSVPTKKGGSYSYRYTELADINQYIEAIDETYYQFIERIDNDDYIMTVRQKDGIETHPIRGCRIVQSNLENYSNPAQEQGSALTYARRYSLLMAYGLATEDDDAQSLNKATPTITTKEEAEKFVITFGKHKSKTLKEIFEEEESYLDYLLNEERTDAIIKDAINLMFEQKSEPQDMGIQQGQIQYITDKLGEKSLQKTLENLNVKNIEELTWQQAHEIEKKIEEKIRIKNKEKEEVF